MRSKMVKSSNGPVMVDRKIWVFLSWLEWIKVYFSLFITQHSEYKKKDGKTIKSICEMMICKSG